MGNAALTVIDCIRFEICGQKEKIVLPEISARFLAEIYQLSKAHDVAHLVGDALNKSGVFEKNSTSRFLRRCIAMKTSITSWSKSVKRLKKRKYRLFR